ncbi:MAG: hypothetical protein LIP23_08690 [Planctomycetes bacterium]|nr:hypothetical protein [Planctomycetota bacterium]
MDETVVRSDPPAAKAHQTQIMRAPRRAGQKKKRLNWPYAMFSILIGALLWLGIDLKRMEEREMDIEIELQRQLPPDWSFTTPPERNAKIKIRGPRQEVSGIAKGELRLLPAFQLGDLDADQYDVSVPLMTSDVRGLPPGVEAISISPETINVRIAKTMTKYLTVVPGQIIGTPQDGYVVGNTYQIDPPAMPVTGFSSFLSKLSNADVLRTLPFSVEGGAGRVGGMVGLEPFTKDGEVVRVPGMVYMTVELEEVPAERTFEQPFEVRALIESPFDRYADLNVSPPSVKITVAGPKSVVDKLRDGDIRDRVPAATGEFNLKIKTIAPARVNVTRIEPDTVKWITREHGPLPNDAAPAGAGSPAAGSAGAGLIPLG